MTSGKAAGIGILVVDAREQPQFLAFLQSVTPKAEPFGRQVFRYESGARMYQCAAKALLLQFQQHAVDVGRGDIGVPHPERSRAELCRWIMELPLQPGKMHLALLLFSKHLQTASHQNSHVIYFLHSFTFSFFHSFTFSFFHFSQHTLMTGIPSKAATFSMCEATCPTPMAQ